MKIINKTLNYFLKTLEFSVFIIIISIIIKIIN